MSTWFFIIPIGLAVVCWCIFGVIFRRTLLSLWFEPVLRVPVLIFESDDWGPGEPFHAKRLQRLADILSKYRDAQGRHPVATLGIVLAIPDQLRMREQGGERYIPLTLADARFAEMRDVIRRGEQRRVFSVQLHGMEHYWPPALMVAKHVGAVASWLSAEFPRTEALPAPLQSRWIDASVLPSKQHEWPEIERAANEEVQHFSQVFGHSPAVAVPPTFVWSEDVERAWANNGVHVIVTPGRRFVGRDEHGKLIASGAPIRNGMRNAKGLVYMVRDDYFEPAKGHRAERAWAALESKTRCGRPTLLEMHRYNFVDDSAVAERSYEELARAIEGALQRFPNLVFTSTGALAKAMADEKSSLIETGMRARLLAWCWRIRQEAPVWRAARITGLALLMTLLLGKSTLSPLPEGEGKGEGYS